MNPFEWEYFTEGGANIIFRYKGTDPYYVNFRIFCIEFVESLEKQSLESAQENILIEMRTCHFSTILS